MFLKQDSSVEFSLRYNALFSDSTRMRSCLLVGQLEVVSFWKIDYLE